MCWVSFKEPKLHRAQRIIPVYKVLYICPPKHMNEKKTVFISPFRYVEYNPGKMHCSDLEGIEESLYERPYEVRYGIHSYMSNMVVLKKEIYGTRQLVHVSCITTRFVKNRFNLHTMGMNQVIVKGYIPKGGLYYVNRNGEVVSDTLVLRKEGYNWKFDKIVL